MKTYNVSADYKKLINLIELGFKVPCYLEGQKRFAEFNIDKAMYLCVNDIGSGIATYTKDKFWEQLASNHVYFIDPTTVTEEKIEYKE